MFPRTHETSLLFASFALVACGCASSSDAPVTSEDDGEAAITDQEIAQGAGSNGADEADPAQGGAAAADEAAGPLRADDFDFGPSIVDEREVVDHDRIDEQMLAACRRARGYRDGHAFTICVVNVDGKPVEVHTAHAYHRMARAAAHAGVQLRVVSGFRTMAQQRSLYHAYESGHGALAAYPGYSNHQSGHALDLNTASPGVYRWLTHHAHDFAFARTVPSEAWHWEHW